MIPILGNVLVPPSLLGQTTTALPFVFPRTSTPPLLRLPALIVTLLLPVRNPTLLLTFCTTDDSARAHRRNILTNFLHIDSSAECSLDDILRRGPERRQDVQGTAVVAAKRTEEKSWFAV